MKPIENNSRFAVGTIVLLLSLFAGQSSFAHGELLIRISEVTRQISLATNKTAKLHLERAELYRMDQNWAAAEADYRRAERLNPNWRSVQVLHAGMLADSGQLEAARALYDVALEKAPKCGDALIGRARVLVKLSQRKAAIFDFASAVELLAEPAAEIFIEFSAALEADGKLDLALQILDHGIKRLGPIPALEGPAIALELSRKNLDAALVRIDSLLPELLRKEYWLARRGDILVEAGSKTKACESYRESLAAIGALPGRIQQSSPMLDLKAHVQEALKRIENPPIAGK